MFSDGIIGHSAELIGCNLRACKAIFQDIYRMAVFSVEPVRRSRAGLRVVITNCGDSLFELSQYYRISGSRIGCFICQIDDLRRTETGRKAFQAPCCILPIGITARSTQQIDLAICTLQKCTAQFFNQRLIVTNCCCQGGVQSSIIK